ncbi:MAG: NADH-quinone oxidoreductase subunit C [archaeon]
MRPGDVLGSFKKKFGASVSKAEITRFENSGVGKADAGGDFSQGFFPVGKKASVERLWISVERYSFKEAVKHLCGLYEMPHFSVIAGCDLGETIELNYIFTLGYGTKFGELCVVLKVALPKKDLVVPTITDLVPAALISEREIQEMLGVKVQGIPDARRLFLPEEFPKGVFPWRRDSKGPERLVRNLNREEAK